MVRYLPRDFIAMCERGRFKLTKIISNTIKTRNTTPEQIQDQKIKNRDLDMDDPPVEKALAIHGNTENNYLSFKPLTRGGVLSFIISIYDLLDIAAPFVLKGCQITMRLYQHKID